MICNLFLLQEIGSAYFIYFINYLGVDETQSLFNLIRKILGITEIKTHESTIEVMDSRYF